jgi:hypothetical protein
MENNNKINELLLVEAPLQQYAKFIGHNFV